MAAAGAPPSRVSGPGPEAPQPPRGPPRQPAPPPAAPQRPRPRPEARGRRRARASPPRSAGSPGPGSGHPPSLRRPAAPGSHLPVPFGPPARRPGCCHSRDFRLGPEAARSARRDAGSPPGARARPAQVGTGAEAAGVLPELLGPAPRPRPAPRRGPPSPRSPSECGEAGPRCAGEGRGRGRLHGRGGDGPEVALRGAWRGRGHRPPPLTRLPGARRPPTRTSPGGWRGATCAPAGLDSASAAWGTTTRG